MNDLAHLAFLRTRMGSSEEYAFRSDPVAIKIERQESELAAA